MADKKEYSPEQVAKSILEKCSELYKSETIAKANTAHELETGAEPNNDDAECPEQLASDGTSLDSGEKKDKKKKIGEDGAEGEESSEGSEDIDSEDVAAADEDMDGDIDGADAIAEADKDEDGDIDGADAVAEKKEESKEAPKKEAVEPKKEDKDEDKDKKDKKLPFEKSERPLKSFMEKRSKKLK